MNIDISDINHELIPMEDDIHQSEIISISVRDIEMHTAGSDTSTDSDKLSKPVLIKVNSDIPLTSNSVQQEPSLSQYTDNHFVTLTNLDLDNIENQNQQYFTHYPQFSNSGSNSPVLSLSGSNNNSNDNSNDNSNENSDCDTDDNHHNHDNGSYASNVKSSKAKYTKLNTSDIERYIRKYHSDYLIDKYANELDILTTFIKGQKNLYIQSNNITQQKLTLLVVPALLVAAAITAFSPSLECKESNKHILTGLNAIVTLFISMVGFLKLESSSEKFFILASLFDTIETSLELSSTKIMVMKTEKDISQLVISKFNEVEDKIAEYKLITPVIIPEEIKTLFPIISHVNIFSFIKKTELIKRGLIEKLKDVKNEIHLIQYKWNKLEIIRKLKVSASYTDDKRQPHSIDHTNPYTDYKKEQSRITYLYKLKNNIKGEIMELQNAYTIMDTIFSREITHAEKNQNKWWICLLCFYWKKQTPSKYIDDMSPKLKEIIYPHSC